MNKLVFILFNFCVLFISFNLTDYFFKRSRLWEKYFASFCGFNVIIILILLFAGLFKILYVRVILLFLLFLLVIVLGLRLFSLCKQEELLREIKEPSKELSFRIWISILFGLGAEIFVLCCFLGTAFGWDDLSYHVVAPAHWLSEHRIFLAPFNYHAYYPLNSELFSLWFMLPFKSDAYLSLSGLYWMIMLIASAMILVFLFTRSYSSSALTGALLIGAKVLFKASRTATATDLSGAGLIFASLVFLFWFYEKKYKREKLFSLIFCGLLAGIALGTKVTFAPAILILMVSVWLFRRKEDARKQRAFYVFIFIFFVLLTGSFWYLRNIFLTGNPLFPAEIGPFKGPFITAEQNHTKLFYHLKNNFFNLGQWIFLIKGYLDWPYMLGIISLSGYIYYLTYFLKKKSYKPEFLLLILGLVLLITFPFVPFSGTNNNPLASLRIAQRFIIIPFVAGIILFSCINWKRKYIKEGIAFLGVINVFLVKTNPYSLILSIFVFLIYSIITKIFKILYPRIELAMGYAFLLLLIFAVWQPIKQNFTNQIIFNWGGENRPVGKGWRAVNSLPAGSRIAWFGPTAYEYYPMFGRNYQLVPTPIASDGSAYLFPHQIWKKEKISLWEIYSKRADLKNLIENLLANHIDYVFVTKWNTFSWPAQQKIFENSSYAEQVYNDNYSAIWKLQK